METEIKDDKHVFGKRNDDQGKLRIRLRSVLRQCVDHCVKRQSIVFTFELTTGRLAIELHRYQGCAASCVLKEGG